MPPTPADRPVALFTGALRHPAPDLAAALASQGCRVALADLNPGALHALAEQLTQSGAAARAYTADLSQKFALQTLLNDLEDEWGRLDLLVNNTRAIPTQPFLELDEWDWRRTLDVNLTGAFLLTQIAGRIMRAQGRGAIIHLAHPDGETAHPAYAATQAGLLQLVQALQQEFAGLGIRLACYDLTETPVSQLAGLLSAALTAPKQNGA